VLLPIPGKSAMAPEAAATSSIRNELLGGLPPGDLDRVRALLTSVTMVSGQVLHEPGEVVEHVYFPTRGMVSIIAQEENGPTVEVGLIGREGLVGSWTLLDSQAIAFRKALVQVTGAALRMSLSTFRQAVDQIPSLRTCCLLHVQALSVQISQTAVCNARHTLPERCARWLLLAHDRADGDEIPLTQEYLSNMLAVRRPGVTVAASILHAAKLIDYSRGRIVIRDRAGLEGAACDCYRVVKVETGRLLRQLPEVAA